MRLRQTAAIVLLLGITVSIAAIGGMPEARKARALLEEGRSAELVFDFATAIDRYQRAFDEAAGNHTLRAEALLRLGLVYQRKGEAGAVSYFDRITNEYSREPAAKEARKRAAAIRSSRAAKPADAAYVDVPGLKTRTVWQDSTTDTTGRVSPDGRYLSFVDHGAGGALALRDLVSRSSRPFAKPGAGTAGPSTISRDGKRIAYAWRPSGQDNGELHVVGLEDLQDRLIYSNAAVNELRPMDWTRTGEIVVLLLTNANSSIATISMDGTARTLKTFVGRERPGNMSVSRDGRFIAYDAPQPGNAGRRNIFTLSAEGGFVEHSIVQHAEANDTVLGWITDTKLLFASDRDTRTGVWAIDVINGKDSPSAPVRVPGDIGEIHTLGTTRGGSLVYGIGKTQVGVLENVLPELARLQFAAQQRPLQSSATVMASIEGIVVKLATNDPIPGADVELARIEGTSAFPLNPGAAEAFAALFVPPGLGGTQLTPELPSALAPEVQYATTGDNGRFVFRNLKPGGYRLVAAKNGEPLFPARYGQRDPRGPGLSFPLAEGQTLKDAKLEMAPTSVITGRVYDSEGQPLGHARVFAVNLTYRGSRRVLANSRGVLTDERGEYRLYALPPGQYLVAAKVEEKSELLVLSGGESEDAASPVVTRRMLPSGDFMEDTYGLVYYGDVLDPDLARSIELGFSRSSFEGADIRLSAARVRSHHIRGVLVNGMTGEPVPGIQVRAVPHRQAPVVFIPFAVTDAKGSFDLSGVVAGTYAVFSSNIPVGTPGQGGAGQRGGNAAIQLSANVQVEVGNADVENLRMVATAPSTITGRAVIESRNPEEAATDLAKVQVSLSWDPDTVGMPNPAAAFGNPVARAAVGGDGVFAITTRSGNYRMVVRGIPSNTYVRSIRMGDEDVLTDGLRLSNAGSNNIEIVITDKSGELKGTAVNGSAVMPNVVVALVPDSPLLRQRSDLYRSATTDAAGRFRFQVVAPGAYKIFAWEYVMPGLWLDPEFMRTYERSGKSIQVVEGKNQDVQVPLTPVQPSR